MEHGGAPRFMLLVARLTTPGVLKPVPRGVIGIPTVIGGYPLEIGTPRSSEPFIGHSRRASYSRNVNAARVNGSRARTTAPRRHP